MTEDLMKRLREGSPCAGDVGCADVLCIEAADEIERLRENLKVAVWSDSEECKFLTSEIARKDVALWEIASVDSVPAGTDKDMYRRWRKVATDAIDAARAAIAPAQEKTDD